MRSILLTLLLFSNVLSFAQISVDGLIRNYTFTGNANDSSGLNLHGTVTNAILTADRFNVPNSAYRFNGQTSFIDIPFIGLDLLEYTYSVWANTTTLPPFGTGTIVLAIGTPYNDQVINTNNSVGVNTGWGGNGYNLTGPPQYIAYSGQALAINDWVHITMVRTKKKLSCYINCELVKEDSTFQNHAPSYGNDQIARIGARQNGATFFNGKIDDLKIYNRPLSYEEITEFCRVITDDSLIVPDDSLIVPDDSLIVPEDSLIVPIDTSSQLVIPNTFSPDNNGINDFFTIKNVELFPNLSVSIFNRWGVEIYFSKPYLNNWNGGDYSDGTYFYLINDGKGNTFKGTLMILNK